MLVHTCTRTRTRMSTRPHAHVHSQVLAAQAAHEKLLAVEEREKQLRSVVDANQEDAKGWHEELSSQQQRQEAQQKNLDARLGVFQAQHALELYEAQQQLKAAQKKAEQQFEEQEKSIQAKHDAALKEIELQQRKINKQTSAMNELSNKITGQRRRWASEAVAAKENKLRN